MPYTPKTAPDYVKKYSPKLVRQWCAVFNSALARCQRLGAKSGKRPGETCETFAFRNANGVLKRQRKNQGDDRMTEEKDEPKLVDIEDFSEEDANANVASDEDPEEVEESEGNIPYELAWTRKFINSLPNSAFAVVEPCWKTNKNARHLPHHGLGGAVDLPHLRNALARMNQIQAVCPGSSTEAIRAKAKRHLVAHAKKLLPTSKFATMEDVEGIIRELDALMAAAKDRLTFTKTGWKVEL